MATEEEVERGELSTIQSAEILAAYLESLDHRIVSEKNADRFVKANERLTSAIVQNIMKGFPEE